MRGACYCSIPFILKRAKKKTIQPTTQTPVLFCLVYSICIQNTTAKHDSQRMLMRYKLEKAKIQAIPCICMIS